MPHTDELYFPESPQTRETRALAVLREEVVAYPAAVLEIIAYHQDKIRKPSDK